METTNTAVLLQVVICTHGLDGLMRTAAMTLPQLPRISWLVECQTDADAPLPDVPEALRRTDINVRFNHTRGLSANRNLMLRDATAPFVLIADDDLAFHPGGLMQLVEIMQAHPDITLFCFRHDGPGRRRYPRGETPLLAHALRRHYPCSCEIALRVDDVRERGLRFNELAGIGAPVLCAGEEDLFVYHLLDSGLRGRFFPITVAIHPALSTYDAVRSPAVWITRGAVFRAIHPRSWLLRVLRHPRHLRLLLKGAAYARRNRL